MAARSKPELFALIIGIDDYFPNSLKLKGAVGDAKKFRRWLEKDLRVPPTRIKDLHNSNATRTSIIHELDELSTNKNIQRDDPIVIYFAGHGSEAPPPKEWKWHHEKVQMILTYDYKRPGSGPDDQVILDWTLNHHLTKLSECKGDNITVIFDSCHSGSGTRSESDVRIRGVLHEGDIPGTLDQHLLCGMQEQAERTRGAAFANEYQQHSLKSHILLAACAPNEEAREAGTSGVFTTALLKVLWGANLSEITYEGLLQRMDRLDRQTPQCEGLLRSRILFDSKVTNQSAVLEASLEGERLTIRNAGAIHGIEKGSQFSVWAARSDLLKPPISTVTTDKVWAFASAGRFKRPAANSRCTAFVVQLKGNPKPKLAVYIPPAVEDKISIADLAKEQEDGVPLGFARSPKEHATVALTYVQTQTHDAIGFEILKPSEKEQKVLHTIQLSHNPDVIGDLRRALEHISFYYHHLHRVNPNPKNVDGGPFSSKFSVDVYKTLLTLVDGDPDGGTVYIRNGPNLNLDGRGIEVSAGLGHSGDTYGFRLKNHLKSLSVYPYLFHFNSGNFKISSIYSPTVQTKKPESNILKAGESLTIGYDDSEFPGYSFFPDSEKLDLELGYVQIYLSTKQTDLSLITQGPLSSRTRGSEPARPTKLGEIWDCITVPIRIRRDRAPAMIGIIGSRGSGKDAFLAELFESCKVPNVKPSSRGFSGVKEYTLPNPDKPGQSFIMVDLPVLDSSDDVDHHHTVLEASVTYLAAQGHNFVSLIWCYDISKPEFEPLDSLNLSLFKDLVGGAMYGQTVILTTGWNSSQPTAAGGRRLNEVVATWQRYPKLESRLKSHPEFKALVKKGAKFKRFGVVNRASRSVGLESDPRALIRELLSTNGPHVLQVQQEASDTQTLIGTTAGMNLSKRIKKKIWKTEEEVNNIDFKLGVATERIRLAVEKEQDISRWKELLSGMQVVNSAFL